ncbi:type IV pilus modification PilV family protein [Homoserinimonas sp. A520]
MDNQRFHTISDTPRSDAGFGLIEIIVSIFLLGLLSISALPLLITAMKASQVTTTVTTAIQLVSQDIDRVRALALPTCAQVQALGGTGADVAGPAGVTYRPSITVETCPAAFPGVVRVTAKVTNAVSGAALASAVTNVMVESP